MGRCVSRMRILVCGDRNWDNANLIDCEISTILNEAYEYNEDAIKYSTIIQGCAKGADSMAFDYADEYGIECLGFPADWNKYGKAAGPIRNQQMLDEGKPDLVLAFHNDIRNSKGTLDMISRANKAGIEVRLYGEGK